MKSFFLKVKVSFRTGLVIISTSIVFGGLAGILTGILLDDRGMGQILPFVFMIVGIIVQFLTNQESPEHPTSEVTKDENVQIGS